MTASGLYGLCLGIAWFIFTTIASQPLGSILLFAFFAVQLSWTALTCWRRTGLPFLTLAMAVGSTQFAVLAILAATGHVYLQSSRGWWIVVGAAMIGVPLVLVEQRVNRAKWARLKEQTKQPSLLDVFMANHIPWLR
jgi:hypothetical protein